MRGIRFRASLAREIASAARGEIAAEALAARGGILLAASLGDALALAEDYAPEHLALYVRDPEAALERTTTAGTVASCR